ncbi:MAG: hypothetical protein V7609_1460 [Verrucomicrobiota bacterium]
MSTIADDYLADLGKEVLSLAEKKYDGGGKDFAAGRQTAFYEVLSLMRQQALAFGLDETAIGLNGADLEGLLTPK